MLSEQDVTDFQLLFKKEFGIEISRDEALEEGLKLVSLMQNVYQPMTQEENDEIEEHRRSTASELLKNVNNNKNEFEREHSERVSS
jgi:transcription termination factor NusB